MKPCALCLWTGSELPGGYSTVNMNTSFPGNSGRGLVISGVTTGSAAYTAVTPTSRDNRRADFIFSPFWVASSGRVVARDKRLAADHRQRDPRWQRGGPCTPAKTEAAWSRGGGAWSVPSPIVDYHSRRAQLHQMPSAAPCGRRLARRPPREPSGGAKARLTACSAIRRPPQLAQTARPL